MTAMDDYLAWHHLQVTSRDLDPVYPVLRNLADRWRLTAEQRAWLVVLHVTYYHLGSALTAFNHCPDAVLLDPDDAMLLTLPTGTERRAHRDQRQLAAHLAAWAEIGEPWAWLTSAGSGWEDLNVHLMTLRGNGRWAAYKTAEMLQKVCGLPTVATDAGHRFSSGPRHGLDLLFPGLPTGQSPETIRVLDEATQYLADELGEPDLAQVETSLCDFHSLCKGRYYLGHDIDQMQEQLFSPRCSVPSDIWLARADVFDRSFLGEFSGWTGVRKDLNRRYVETGELTWI